jgi:putative sterol carrier protein
MFGPMHPEVFTDSWVAAWERELNASPAYREAAANWEGAVALRMSADASLGIPEPRTVWLDLYHGLCRAARSATATDLTTAKYLIEAEPAVWRDLLAGRLSPIAALLAGKLRLAQGSLMGLLPYAAAAQLLVTTATIIQQQFPESVL